MEPGRGGDQNGNKAPKKRERENVKRKTKHTEKIENRLSSSHHYGAKLGLMSVCGSEPHYFLNFDSPAATTASASTSSCELWRARGRRSCSKGARNKHYTACVTMTMKQLRFFVAFFSVFVCFLPTQKQRIYIRHRK